MVLAILLFAPFLGSDFTATLLGKYGATDRKALLYPLLMLPVSAVFVAMHLRIGTRVGAVSAFRRSAVVWGTFAAGLALQILSWRLVSFSSVTRSGVWSTHADPVFFALSQTVGGRTLLVDLPSQYGLFPELLAPLFQVVGLSVFKLTLLFALMQAMSLVALLFVLSRLVKSRAVLLAAGLCLLMVTFETVLYFVGIDERYFQYWPIRFFWPAMSVLALHRFAVHRSLGRLFVLSVISAVGLLWNTDSGLFIVIAVGAYLLTRMIFAPGAQDGAGGPVRREWSRTEYLRAVLIHSCTVLGTVGVFFLLLFAKAGAPLNLAGLIEYQKVFMRLGLMMLPLPLTPHPWMVVLALYVGAMLVAMECWRRRVGGVAPDLCFHLGMLGLGLFVYYSGRSHVLNLVTVCWPAVLIVAAVSDSLLRSVRSGRLPVTQLVLPGAGVAILMLGAFSFLARVPMMASDAAKLYRARAQPEEAFVQSELAMIRNRASGRECLILSQRQGIYYAESGLVSPVQGPGIVEILLRADYERERNLLLKGPLHPCVFLGVGPFTDPGLKIPLAEVLARYAVVEQTEGPTLLFLQPR